MNYLKNKNKNSSKGFTLIEFVVILVIFAVVAAVVLFDFRGFTARTRIENLAQNVALAVREAQVFGSTRTASEVNLQYDRTALQYTGYVGVYIPESGGVFGASDNPLPDGEILTNGFAVFRDSNDNLELDDDDIVLDVLRLDPADTIANITAGDDPDPDSQSTVGGDFYVLFKRPSLSAFIYSADDGSSTRYHYATITVAGSTGLQKQIQITAGGQISVLESQ